MHRDDAVAAVVPADAAVPAPGTFRRALFTASRLRTQVCPGFHRRRDMAGDADRPKSSHVHEFRVSGTGIA